MTALPPAESADRPVAAAAPGTSAGPRARDPRVSDPTASRPAIDVDLIGHASHEMRNPLTVVVGVLEALNSGLAGPMPDDAAELLHLAARNAVQLQTLIEQFGEYCRLTKGDVVPRTEVLTLAPVLREAMSARASDAYDADVAVELPVEPPAGLSVRSTRGALLRALDALIVNAIRHSKPAGLATGGPRDPDLVTLAVAVRDDRVAIQVRDRGPGIADEFRPQLFAPFARSARTRAAGIAGAGLGLAIAERLVAQVGGTLACPRTDSGGVFEISLPSALD